ncbi:hypothetical protein ACFLZX_00300 [Nanoarchaeota archaeon]
MIKRGQGAINASILVAIMFGLILLYILAIPEEDRDTILENGDNGKPSSSRSDENITVLEESVGTIEDRDLDEVEHDIPSFTLFRTTGAKVLKKTNPYQVRNGIFDYRSKEVRFTIDDTQLTENVLLSFSVGKAQGILMIKLNGDVIFEGELEVSTPPPVTLAGEDLERDNVLEFSVSGVGWKFWTTNQYQFDGLLITAEIADVARESSKAVFFVSQEEIDYIESASFRFNPDCQPSDVGVLQVVLNRRQLFSGIPDCGALNKIEFSPGLIDRGENTLEFTTTEGTYLIDSVMVKTELAEEVYPIYYFEVNETLFEEVDNRTREAYIRLRFVDDDEVKRLDLNINDHLTNVDQDEPDYERRITTWIEEGNNYVEIRPKTRLNIVDLKVVLEEQDDD